MKNRYSLERISEELSNDPATSSSQSIDQSVRHDFYLPQNYKSETGKKSEIAANAKAEERSRLPPVQFKYLTTGIEIKNFGRWRFKRA